MNIPTIVTDAAVKSFVALQWTASDHAATADLYQERVDKARAAEAVARVELAEMEAWLQERVPNWRRLLDDLLQKKARGEPVKDADGEALMSAVREACK